MDANLTAWADRDRIVQVLNNLIGNAVKFTPPQGKVTVAAQRNGNGWVQVSVADTGLGIPLEEADKIFDEFYQIPQPGEPKAKGMGLGLTIAKKLVEKHGGKIWVQSKPAKGSIFFFTLPARRMVPLQTVLPYALRRSGYIVQQTRRLRDEGTAREL